MTARTQRQRGSVSYAEYDDEDFGSPVKKKNRAVVLSDSDEEDDLSAGGAFQSASDGEQPSPRARPNPTAKPRQASARYAK
jgi:hypothetical protein